MQDDKSDSNSGTTWAKHNATLAELERLSEYAEGEGAFKSCPQDAFSAAEILGAYVTDGIVGGSRQEAHEFWQNVGLSYVPGDKTAQEFAEAALKQAEVQA